MAAQESQEPRERDFVREAIEHLDGGDMERAKACATIASAVATEYLSESLALLVGERFVPATPTTCLADVVVSKTSPN